MFNGFLYSTAAFLTGTLKVYVVIQRKLQKCMQPYIIISMHCRTQSPLTDAHLVETLQCWIRHGASFKIIIFPVIKAVENEKIIYSVSAMLEYIHFSTYVVYTGPVDFLFHHQMLVRFTDICSVQTLKLYSIALWIYKSMIDCRPRKPRPKCLNQFNQPVDLRTYSLMSESLINCYAQITSQ